MQERFNISHTVHLSLPTAKDLIFETMIFSQLPLGWESWFCEESQRIVFSCCHSSGTLRVRSQRKTRSHLVRLSGKSNTWWAHSLSRETFPNAKTLFLKWGINYLYSGVDFIFNCYSLNLWIFSQIKLNELLPHHNCWNWPLSRLPENVREKMF